MFTTTGTIMEDNVEARETDSWQTNSNCMWCQF